MNKGKGAQIPHTFRAVVRREVKDVLSGIQEVKNYTGGQPAVAIAATGTVLSMTPIPQGDGEGQRSGEQIVLKSCHVNMKVMVGAQGVIASADEWDALRVLVFRWHEDDSVNPPTLAKLLKLGPACTDYTVAPHNLDYKHQYSMMMDKVFDVFNSPVWNGSALLWENGPFSVVSKNGMNLTSRMGNRHVNYVGNATTGSGMIYVLAVSDSNFASHPTLSFQWVVEYTDS